MKNTALLAIVLIGVTSPSMAKSHHRHHVRQSTSQHHVYAQKPDSSHAHITCEMVRAYVAQVGLVQARAIAQSAGMTAAEERRAIRCLENGA